jgi:hypothetical protein
MSSRLSEGPFRVSCQLLLSANLAFSALTMILYGSIFWTAQFFGWKIGFNSLFHRNFVDSLGQHLAFFAWGCGITIVIFLGLRLLSKAQIFTRIFIASAALLNLGAPAVCFWYVWRLYRFEFYGLNYIDWLMLEWVVALSCSLLFRWRRWPLSVLTSLFLLSIHTFIWYDAYKYVAFSLLDSKFVPVISGIAIFAWAMYAIRKDRFDEDKLPA